MTAHISSRSLTQIELQIPRCRTKWHRNNRTIQNSIEFKLSAYVLHDIRQVAALNFATFWWWVAYVHVCVCCCTCVAYVCAYMRENLMFEVYGGESKSMSDQYGRFFLFLAIY